MLDVLLWSTVATIDVDDVDRTFLFRENTHFSIATYLRYSSFLGLSLSRKGMNIK